MGSVAGRLGPALTQLAIDHGMGLSVVGTGTGHAHRGYLYGVVALYFVLIAVSIGVGYARTLWAGRLNESVIYRLQRAAQLLNIDLNDAEAVFRLEAAARTLPDGQGIA